MSIPSHLGYLAVVLLVGGESLGLLLPGETAIVAAGILARSGGLDLALVIPVAAAAAIAGDSVAYLLGRRGVRMLLLVRGPLREHRVGLVERGDRFFARYGGRAVFLGRWIVFARVTVPWLAGASELPARTFFLFNALGGVTWSSTAALAGYALGAGAAIIFTSITVAAVAALLVLALTTAVRARRRGARRGLGP